MEKGKMLVIGLAICVVVLAGISGVVYAKYNIEKNNYENLREDYTTTLKERNQTISSWENKYNGVMNNYTSLESDYDDLESDYNSLNSDYNGLQSDYNSLNSDYNGLQSDYNGLQSDYSNLQNNFNSLQLNFDDYKELINIRTPSGTDKKGFVTPDENAIQTKAAAILGGGFDGSLSKGDISKINDWVHDHIDYNYDIYVGEKDHIGKECWQYPSETLGIEHGDCEDHALLMLSLCLAEEKVGWIYCAEVQLEKNGEKYNHMCVFVNVEGDRLRVLDPTWDETDWADGGWESTEDRSEYTNLNNYCTETGHDGIEVKCLFNYQTYKTFSNNEAFYNWF